MKKYWSRVWCEFSIKTGLFLENLFVGPAEVHSVSEMSWRVKEVEQNSGFLDSFPGINLWILIKLWGNSQIIHIIKSRLIFLVSLLIMFSGLGHVFGHLQHTLNWPAPCLDTIVLFLILIWLAFFLSDLHHKGLDVLEWVYWGLNVHLVAALLFAHLTNFL